MVSCRPFLVALVHSSRAGQGRQFVMPNRTTILSWPSERTGVQPVLGLPCGQVAVRAS